MPLVATTFPGFEIALRHLVANHLSMTDEPLMLAIYYSHESNPNDVYLFEVIENFGSNLVDPDRELMEVTYSAGHNFDLADDQVLHLVMTNPVEFRQALRENWPQIAELKQAIAAGQFMTLYPPTGNAQGLRALIGA